MGTPLQAIYAELSQLRTSSEPVTAESLYKPDGFYYGMVKFGGASTTTLQEPFANEDDAKAHAQICIEALDKINTLKTEKQTWLKGNPKAEKAEEVVSNAT